MADLPTINVGDSTGMGHGFLGSGLGAGFVGGAIAGLLFNGGGWGGWGNRGGAVDASVDTASILSAVNGVQNAVNQGQLTTQQSMSQQNMFLGNMINNTGDQITGAINASTLADAQNTAAIQSSLCGINQNISNQGADTRLQMCQLSAQMQQQCCELRQEIAQEACATRQAIYDQTTQALRDKVTELSANNAALVAQANLVASQAAQTQTILAAIGGAAVTRTTTSAS